MQDVSLTLVSNPICPFVQRVAIALLEKGVPFNQQWVDLKDPPEWFRHISPAGKVPLLKLERTGQSTVVLFESLPICEFVEEAWPEPPLHPAEPISRARNRAWMEQVTPMLGDAWTLVTSPETTTAAEALREKLAKFEAAHSGKTWFQDDRFGFVDAVIAPLFRYFDAMPPEGVAVIEAGLPAMAQWRLALRDRASVRAAVPEDFFVRLSEFVRR